MTHYEVLDVSPCASPAEIRRAYLAIARRHHPDRHPDQHGDDAVMQRINEAWTVLGDRERRRIYDQSQPPPPAEPVWQARSGGAHPDFVPVDGFGDGADDLGPDDFINEGTGRKVPGWQQLLPVGLLIAALVNLILGLVVNLRELLALGAILLVLAGAGFVLTPMLAVLRTYERDPDR